VATPLTEIAAIETGAHEGLRGFGIDSPKEGDRAAAYGFDLRGWVLGRDRPATAVEVLHEGVLLRRLPLDVPRPDVAEAHPDANEAEMSGFFAPIGALTLSPSFEVRVRARLEDKTRVPLASVRGTRAELRTPFQPRIQPLAVTTLGRTGSTAVVRLLGSHPEIVAYRPFEYEPRVATYWIGVLRALAEPASYRRQITPSGPIDGSWWLGAEPPFPRPVRDPEIGAWLGGGAIEQLGAFCQSRVEELYLRAGALAGRPAPAYFVEKFRPDAVPALLSELYPGGREVVLVRDFRDMLASMFAYNAKRGMGGGFRRDRASTDADFVMERVKGSVDALAGAWRSRSHSAHLLRYEDLVLNPEETVEALLQHLGLDAAPGTIDAMLASLTTAETEGHRTIADPKATIGRWRSDLSPELVEVCQEALGPSLRTFGYTDDGA
jgi:sulfotransferase family protein